MTNWQPCFETDLSNMIINFGWQPDSCIKKCRYKSYLYCLWPGYCLFCTSWISPNACGLGSFTHSQTHISSRVLLLMWLNIFICIYCSQILSTYPHVQITNTAIHILWDENNAKSLQYSRAYLMKYKRKEANILHC